MTGWAGIVVFAIACWFGAIAIFVWFLERASRVLEQPRRRRR